MGLLNGRMDNSIYSAVFGKKGPSLGPVSYPVDPPAKAIDEAGSCLMPEDTNGSGRCQSPELYDGLTAMDPVTCRCTHSMGTNTSMARLGANLRCSTVRCQEGVATGLACACGKSPSGRTVGIGAGGPTPPVEDVTRTATALIGSQFSKRLNAEGKCVIPSVNSLSQAGRAATH